ncbi:MAG: DUF7305 domain-containing protein [Verrucomicrobiota bacterium]
MPPAAPRSPCLRRARPERGTVLIVTLLVLALLALGLGSYLSLNLTTSRLARHSFQQNAAFNLAEAGAEEALWSFNQAHAQNPAAWQGWHAQGAAAWRKFEDFDLGGGAQGSIKVYVNNTSPSAGEKPRAVALAQVGSGSLPASSRMIEITLSRRSFFANGIVARDTVKFAGANTTVDSWNSDPDNNPATAPVPYSAEVRADRGSIATLAIENTAMLVNQADVWGYVATGGGAPEVGTNGSIRGADTPADVMIDPARVTTDFSADLPDLAAPLDGTPLAAVGATLGTPGEATRWRVANLSLKGNDTLTILGDVTLILTATTGDALSVTGNASIIVPDGSSLTVYVEADLKIAGNGLGNRNTRPVTCRIYGTNTSAQAIHLAGNGTLKAVVYAPNADVQINGNGDILGAIVGGKVTFTGNAAFHYDESLAREEASAPFGVSRWRELTDAAERAAWEPVFAGW